MFSQICKDRVIISIHALREEGDTLATTLAKTYKISIHALREEGDFSRRTESFGKTDFYPRPPRGGRLMQGLNLIQGKNISIHALREEGDA